MNYMYHFGIMAHYYSALGILVVILFNMYKIQRATNLQKLRRFMTIFTPMGSVMLGSVVFTGVIMMAAKHLEFTWQNNLMIAIALVFIVLEVKRAKRLRFLMQKELDSYKQFAFVLLSIEAAMVVVVSTVMRL